MMLMLLLNIVIYAVIGLCIGRVWYSVWTRRGDPMFAAMGVAVGVFWPMMLVIIPVCFIAVYIIEHGIAPAVRWVFMGLDSAVDRIVPKKHD